MNKIIDTIIGNLDEKRQYKQTEARAKALPSTYAEAYKDIKKYLFNTSGLLSIDPLTALVDMFEQAAAEGKDVFEITGPDVAAFADELVRGEKSYFEERRKKLNDKMTIKQNDHNAE